MDRVDNEDEVSRRGVMLAAGVAAALAAGVARPARAADGAAAAPALARSPYALMNLPRDQVKTQLASSSWSATKQAMVRSGKFPFLKPFANDLCVDQIVYEVTSAIQNDTPPYDPYQLESLVASASDLLDRCLSNRREMYDIEEQAIRRALEYKLYADQLQPLMEMDLADWVEQQRKAESAGQKAAAKRFDAARQDDLADGFETIAQATAQSSDLAVAGEQKRKADVQAKWSALNSFQTALQDRHDTPGCSLNYAERYGRIEQLLRQDIRVAYGKLRCIEAGMKQVFGLSVALPPPQLQGYLDAMVMFLRGAVESAGIATLEEVQFDHVVSLHQPRATNTRGSAQVQLIADAAWDAATGTDGDGVISFQLKDEFPAPIQRLRVRAIGLSVLFTDVGRDLMTSGNGSVQHDRAIRAVIAPPQAPDLFSPGGFRDRPPVVVAAATWFDPSSIRMSVLPAVANLDPRTGTWRIQLSPAVFAPTSSAVSRWNTIFDVKLHLQLAALIDKSVFPWPAV